VPRKKKSDVDAAEVRFLDDVRVLEIASLSPTQVAMHLADLGAEVIKIEPPKRGDATRIIGTKPGFNDAGMHRRWNRGKKSVAVDTRTPEGAALVRQLVPLVDIVVEGFRPGTLAKMGLSFPEMVELNPDIVVVAMSGFGQTGPYRDLPSHGIGFDAVAGLSGIEDDEDGRPRVPTNHVYHGALMTPLLAATSAIAALSWSRRTGKPVYLDLAQADVAAYANYNVEDAVAEKRSAEAGEVPLPVVDPDAPPAPRSTMQAYRTRDGKVLMIMTLERKFFVRLAETVGRDDLLATIPEDQYMVRGNKQIDDALLEIMATKDLAEWMEIFSTADVPVVPVHQSSDVADDPHLQTRFRWLSADQGTVTMKSPVISEPVLADPIPAQPIGQHTAEVLADIGVDADELARLAEAGIIRLADQS